MQRPENLQYREGTLNDLVVKFPAPYLTGHVCNEGEASILNQTLKENISNNLREKAKAGVPIEGTDTFTAHTVESLNALIDEYFDGYEPGVRRGGNGEARITDPVEREARKLARISATELVKQRGLKPADVDMAVITNQLFEANRELLMKSGRKIVEDAKKTTSGISFEGIDISAKNGEQELDEEEAEADADADAPAA